MGHIWDKEGTELIPRLRSVSMVSVVEPLTQGRPILLGNYGAALLILFLMVPNIRYPFDVL